MLEMEANHGGVDGQGTEAEMQITAAGDAAAASPAPAVVVYKKGAWGKEEDEKLRRAVDKYGLRNWVAIEKHSGLGRPAKNCRLRWLNYLRPNLKKYPFTQEEEDLIFELHSKYGNSWSRIAAKLPGRSDNEIKNFWHKRAKKRHKHHLPIYHSTTTTTTTTIQHNLNNHANEVAIDSAKGDYFPNKNDNDIPTFYPQHTLPSTSAPSPRIQPSTPNAFVNTPSHQEISIHSPHFAMSTPQSHFQIPQCRMDHLTDQTTPTSRTQNLLVSPHPKTQPNEIPTASPHIQTDFMAQNDGCQNEFKILRDPPVLSAPQSSLRRFSRNNSKLSSNPSHSVPYSPNIVLPTASPMQMQFSSSMVSPRSPLKLNLSPRVQMPPTQTTDSQITSFSTFQLQPPNAAPLSPLKLRLSIPIPSESFFQSNSAFHLSPSSGVMPSIQRLLPSQTTTIDFNNNAPQGSSQVLKMEPPSIQVEPDGSLAIMEELREAQARVKFLKNKLRLKRASNKRNPFKESREASDSTEGPIDGNSTDSATTKECMLHTRSCGTQNVIDEVLRAKAKAPIKNSKKRATLKNTPRKKGDTTTIASGESSETKPTPNESSQKDYSSFTLGEIFERGNSTTFEGESHSIDFFNHLNDPNASNPPNSNSFDDKKSTLLQNGTLQGDLFGQMFSPPMDAFNPVYSQNTATTHIKPGEDNIRSSYLHPGDVQYYDYNLGQEITNGFGRKLEENVLIDDNPGVKSTFCQLINNQYPNSGPLDSHSLVSNRVIEQEYFRVEQLPHQTVAEIKWELFGHKPVSGNQAPAANLIDNLVYSRYLVGPAQECPARGGQYFGTQSTADELERGGKGCESVEPWRQEHSREQSFMQGLLVDNLWPEGLMASEDPTFSTSRYQESKNWNDEAGEILKQEVEHDHINTMSEELSSLLEFFPTTSQTLDWYNDTRASGELESLQLSSTSHPQLTVADYF